MHMSDKPKGSKEETDLVVAPGGPRPKEQVHGVGPGQSVRRNEEGTYTVIPEDEPPTDDKERR
jgi:hypothetical protein